MKLPESHWIPYVLIIWLSLTCIVQKWTIHSMRKGMNTCTEIMNKELESRLGRRLP